MDSANKPRKAPHAKSKKSHTRKKATKQATASLAVFRSHTYMWVAVGIGVAGALTLTVWGFQKTLARQQQRVTEQNVGVIAVEDLQRELGQAIDDIKVNLALIENARNSIPTQNDDLPNTLSGEQVSQLANIIQQQQSASEQALEPQEYESEEEQQTSVHHLPE